MPTSNACSRKPRWLIIAANLWQNLVAAVRFRLGKVDSDIGATHMRLTTKESVDYINRVYQDYLRYGDIGATALKDKRVLEIGPGDNLGVALRFYAAGASQVVCLDKYYARRIPEHQEAIYRMLREQLNDAERDRYDRAVDLANGARMEEKAVRYVYGIGAEKVDRLFELGSFDLIVSRAVMWEIYDVDDALRALDKVLRPGGIMIHKIACLDWMFRQDGYHPLEFLTVSEPIYKLIARNSGKSNRRTIEYYRRAMNKLRYTATFHITRVVGGKGEDFPPRTTSLVKGEHYTEETLKLIRDIRPRLRPRFRKLSDEDLLVEDMFLVAVKPSSRSSR